MADILSTGVSGLLAMQRALDVTSHNIANAATPGYSRQSIELSAVEPQFIDGGYFGRGVQIQQIRRNGDGLLTLQERSAQTTYSRLDTFTTNAQALSNLFADSTTGLSASLQKLTNAISGVANDPTSVAARQVLLGEAQGLQARLSTYQARLDQIDGQINTQLTSEAASITSLSQNIARLNDQIVTAQAITGQPPNDLLDARDQQLSELAKHINVTLVPQDGGAVNVMVGNGQPLVLGNTANALVAAPDKFDPARVTLGLQSAGVTVDVTSSLTGGSVGGALDFRSQMLDPARNELGRIAVATAAVINDQQHKGLDLQGSFGGDLFGIGGVDVLSSRTNTTAVQPTVTRTGNATSALTTDDYVLSYAGGTWSMRNAATGAAVTMSGAGTVANPYTANGLSIVVPAGAASGDSFKIKPVGAALSGFSVLINDPSKIAASAPILATASTANTGDSAITQGEVLDPTNPNLQATTTLQFIDATHYSVNGSGSFSYTAGANIDLNGWRVVITGSPVAGDSYTVKSNAGGVGDNRNALAMAQLFGTSALTNGTESINSATSRFVGGIGVATGQAQTSLDAQKVIVDNTKAAADAVSGVNLDEEAANMIRYQQAYQAMAQIIRVTQSVFDSLLQATGR